MAIPRRLAATAPEGIVPTGINDRHQIVGAAQTPAATSSLQRTGAQPPLGMEETTS